MRGAQRFAALGRAQKESAAAAANGKNSSWKNGSKLDEDEDDDEDDEDDEEGNGRVTVTAPSDVGQSNAPSQGHALQREGVTPLHAKSSEDVEHVVDEARTRTIPKPPPSSQPAATEIQRQDSMDTFLTAEEEEELRIPGSFDIPSPRRGMSVNWSSPGSRSQSDEETEGGRDRETWAGMFKRMGLGRE